MTLIDPWLTDPTPDSQDLTQLFDLLNKLKVLDTYERQVIFAAWDAAANNSPTDSKRRAAWNRATILAVLPEHSPMSPFLFWEAVKQAAKPGITAEPPTAWEIVHGLQWAALHQSS